MDEQCGMKKRKESRQFDKFPPTRSVQKTRARVAARAARDGGGKGRFRGGGGERQTVPYEEGKGASRRVGAGVATAEAEPAGGTKKEDEDDDDDEEEEKRAAELEDVVVGERCGAWRGRHLPRIATPFLCLIHFPAHSNLLRAVIPVSGGVPAAENE